ncbi:hypothetical protein Bca101_092973 [Brassica carinata]
MNSLVLSLAPKFINLQTLILRQDKPELEDNAVDAIENHCHELQESLISAKVKPLGQYTFNVKDPLLTRLVILLADESVVALADWCIHLRSLGLYYCAHTFSCSSGSSCGS